MLRDSSIIRKLGKKSEDVKKHLETRLRSCSIEPTVPFMSPSNRLSHEAGRVARGSVGSCEPELDECARDLVEPMVTITDPDVQRICLKVDPTPLLAAATSVAIPPPGHCEVPVFLPVAAVPFLS